MTRFVLYVVKWRQSLSSEQPSGNGSYGSPQKINKRIIPRSNYTWYFAFQANAKQRINQTKKQRITSSTFSLPVFPSLHPPETFQNRRMIPTNKRLVPIVLEISSLFFFSFLPIMSERCDEKIAKTYFRAGYHFACTRKDAPLVKSADITTHERSKGRSLKHRVSLCSDEKQVSLHRYYYSDDRFRETALPEFLPERFLPFPHD